jgi:glutamate--cysteine ligase
MMQVIAGIHFNFSFSENFWQTLQKLKQNTDSAQKFQSDSYFAMLRNYKRFSWLIPYLYGSSPIICSSFLQGKKTTLPFKKSAQGYLYLPYATSLRMSDLGYTNNAQANLQICYNDVEGYVTSVRKAINLPSAEFAKIGVKVNGEYRQLNSNVLQIENELYAPIRPKRVAKSGEKPSDALADRGVEYIEVRSLDVNPFVDTGISSEQIYFLDVFLTYCALAPSELFDSAAQQRCSENMNNVVSNGRDPKLLLTKETQKISVKDWGNQLFAEFARVAKLLDKANKTTKYSDAIAFELAKINDPSLTLSAQLIASLENGEYDALTLAKQYKAEILSRDYQIYDENYFKDTVIKSHQQQQEIEKTDTLTFDEFLQQYFTC